MTLEEIINKHFNNLNENDHYILRQILDNLDILSEMNIEKISKLCNTSTASMHRLAKKLGFSGFIEFKFFLKTQQDEVRQTSIELNYGDVLLSDLKITLDSINKKSIEDICATIYSSKNLYGYGTGWKQSVALKTLGNDLMYYNKPIIQLRTLADKEHILSSISSNDVFFIISLSGNTKDMEPLLNMLKMKGVKIISITSLETNLIASRADYSLYFKKIDTISNNVLHWSPITLNVVLDYLSFSYAKYLSKINNNSIS